MPNFIKDASKNYGVVQKRKKIEDEFQRRINLADTEAQKDKLKAARQKLRDQFGPMRITSGYRSPKHPIEARKSKPGTHASGRAADIAVSRGDAVKLLRLAMMDGRFTGFGIQQKGAKRFIHLDSTTTNRPTIWSY